MSVTRELVVLWTPRLLGIALSLFLAMFALDAFTGRGSAASAVADFAVHLMPAVGMAIAVALAWRRPWLGGLVFICAGVAYSLSAQRIDWILVIALPLCLVGLLFLYSAWRQVPAR